MGGANYGIKLNEKTSAYFLIQTIPVVSTSTPMMQATATTAAIRIATNRRIIKIYKVSIIEGNQVQF